jgi:hypothetical protein
MAHATQLNMHARSNDTPKRARYCPAHARFSRWHARPWHATARLTRFLPRRFSCAQVNDVRNFLLGFPAIGLSMGSVTRTLSNIRPHIS